MPISDNDAYVLIQAELPPGLTAWQDLTATGAIGRMWKAVAAAANAYGYSVLETLRSELGGQTLTARLPDWETIMGVAGDVLATYGSLAQRRARMIARRSEFGQSSLPNIKTALSAVVGNPAALTIVEASRSTLRTAHTYAVPGLPVTLTHAATTTMLIAVAENAPVSAAGAQMVLQLSGAAPTDLISITLTGPDGTTAATVVTGLGAAPAQYMLWGQKFAGKQCDGVWTLLITNPNAGVDATLSAGAGLFVEGLGRNLAGAEGLGAAQLQWAALVDTTLVTSSYTADAARAIVRRWNDGHTQGFLAQKNSSGGTPAVFDDVLTPVDGGLFDT